jgi:hypothetical protein
LLGAWKSAAGSKKLASGICMATQLDPIELRTPRDLVMVGSQGDTGDALVSVMCQVSLAIDICFKSSRRS